MRAKAEWLSYSTGSPVAVDKTLINSIVRSWGTAVIGLVCLHDLALAQYHCVFMARADSLTTLIERQRIGGVNTGSAVRRTEPPFAGDG